MARQPKPWYRQGKRMWFSTIDGQQVPLNVSDPNDQAGAWAALKEMLSGAVKEAVTAATAPTASPVKPGTVKDLVAAWLATKAGDVKPATLRSYGQHLGWLVKHWGGVQLSDLSADKVKEQHGKERWSDTHRANVLWTCNVLFKWSGREDQFALPPKESRGADSVIPEAVHRRILAETKGDFRQLVQFLWFTGCRPGEATGLEAAAVNLETGSAKIKQHKTRHKGKSRTIHLCAEAVQVIRDQVERYGSGLLFRGTGGRRFSLQAMTMRFERVSEKVRHKVTSYMYRHTFATRALVGGESDPMVAALLGHSSTAMVHKHYSHISAQGRALKEAAERVAKK